MKSADDTGAASQMLLSLMLSADEQPHSRMINVMVLVLLLLQVAKSK